MSERRCFVCDKCFDKGHARRIFLTPGEDEKAKARCPEHGRMRREPNRPYRGGKR